MMSQVLFAAILAHVALTQAAPLDVDAFTKTMLLAPRATVCLHAVDASDHKCFEGCTTGLSHLEVCAHHPT